jgi:hypothetical protein
MRIWDVIGKFLAVLSSYLFGGNPWIAWCKRILWAVGLLAYGYFTLKTTDKLALIKEGSDGAMLSLQMANWVLFLSGGIVLLLAIGAACVRYRSVVFKVGNEIESDDPDFFRLAVDRRGWAVDIQAPAAKVQQVIDAQGNLAFPRSLLPFELTWSHQSEAGKRPVLVGAGH